MDPERSLDHPRRTVLIAEDNEGVRELVSLIMSRRGWSTLEAGDGEVALALLDRDYQTIDLLISDIVMPRVSGFEVAIRALARRSDLPVVLMSVTNRRELPPGSIGDDIVFLQKPFTSQELMAAVDAAFGHAGEADAERRAGGQSLAGPPGAKDLGRRGTGR